MRGGSSASKIKPSQNYLRIDGITWRLKYKQEPWDLPDVRFPRVLPISCQFKISSLVSREQLIERGVFEVCQLHCPYCCDSSFTQIRDDSIPVRRLLNTRPPKGYASMLCRCNPLRLTLLDGRPRLLGDCAEQLDQDVIDHLEYPRLILRKFHHRCWQIQNLQSDLVRFEIFQLLLRAIGEKRFTSSEKRGIMSPR